MNRRKNSIRLVTIAIVFIILMNLGNSCNQPESKSASPVTGNLYQLILTKAEYDAIVTPGVMKIDFQFYFRDDSTNYPTLVAYGSRARHYERGGDSVILKTNGVAAKALPVAKFFGTQEVTRVALEDKFRSIFGSNPTSWNFTHLLFIPDITSTGQIFYTIKVICPGCPVTAADLYTNPSPPKNGE